MLLERQEIFHGRVIDVTVDRVRLPNDHVTDLEIVHHPGGAAIVALDAEQRVCLVHQYRHAAGGFCWELPAGKLEVKEPPLRTAQRELAEEGGMSAAHWLELGDYVSSPGVFTERIYLYLATDLAPVPMALEAAEVLQPHWLPLGSALDMAARGTIQDGKTLLGLYRAALHAGRMKLCF